MSTINEEELNEIKSQLAQSFKINRYKDIYTIFTKGNPEIKLLTMLAKNDFDAKCKWEELKITQPEKYENTKMIATSILLRREIY